MIPMCGKCMYYNGDENDKEAFCDKKETYVQSYSYCEHWLFRPRVNKNDSSLKE